MPSQVQGCRPIRNSGPVTMSGKPQPRVELLAGVEPPPAILNGTMAFARLPATGPAELLAGSYPLIFLARQRQ